jgi:hypothetical protein
VIFFWCAANHAYCGIGVPVIAIFTKFDGLVTRAFGKIRSGGFSLKEAKDRQFEQAHEMLNTDFIVPLMSMNPPPSDYVRLDG